MYAIIIGAGRTGMGLARTLTERGVRVALIEIRPEVAESARRTLPGAAIVAADGATINGLLEADPARADVLIAVTGRDEANLLATTLARREFAVPRIIARAIDPAYRWLYTETLGVDLALSDAEWLAQFVMEDVTVDGLARWMRLRRAGLAVHESEVLAMPDTAPRVLGTVAFPAGCVPVAVYRGGQTLAPAADLSLQPGDVVVAVAAAEQGPALAAALNPPAPERPPIEVLDGTSEQDTQSV